MSNMKFELMLEKTLKSEGGYSNHPTDTGGETFRGVSRNNFPDWDGWKIIDNIKKTCSKDVQESSMLISRELSECVKDFYRTEFYSRLRCGLISSDKVAAELFDTGVNCGISRAVKIFQSALNLLNINGKYYADLDVDGKIGINTIGASNILVKASKETTLLCAMNGEQYSFYKTITINKPAFEVFFAGWMRRIDF